LEDDALESILLGAEQKDLPVVVVSVAGPFRLGKSFLLNFFLRYLEHEEAGGATAEAGDWLENGSDMKEDQGCGFGYNHSADVRHTTGIWMLDTPIIKTLPDGRKVALLLVDTQGTFDNDTTAETNAMVFAFNSLLSSFQVYNISKRIGEDILTSMHLFTKFGQMVGENQTAGGGGGGGENKAFQSLMFLIRDWGNARECGLEEGAKHLERVLHCGQDTVERSQSGADSGNRELLEVRKDIQASFEEISCFLLPHPGHVVAEAFDEETDAVWAGEIKKIRKIFRDHLRSLCPLVLDAENLAVKRVLGEEVTCGSLFTYMQEWVKCFHDGNLPEVTTVFVATAKVNHYNIRDKAQRYYKDEVHKLCATGFIEQDELQARLASLKDEANAMYRDTPKLDHAETEAEVTDELEEDIEDMYKEALAQNDDKSIMKVLRTPGTLLLIAFITNIASTILGFISPTIGGILDWMAWVAFLLVAVNAFCKYTGQMPEVGTGIDEAVAVAYDVMYEQFLKAAGFDKYVPKDKKSK